MPFFIDVAYITQRGPIVVDRMGGCPGLVRRIVILETAHILLEVDHAFFAWSEFFTALIADAQHAVIGTTNRAGMGEPILRAYHTGAISLGTGLVLPQNGPPPAHHLLFDFLRARRCRVNRTLVTG